MPLKGKEGIILKGRFWEVESTDSVQSLNRPFTPTAMVNTRKFSKSGIKSVEKKNMQSSKALEAKPQIPKAKAPKKKKASPLRSVTESLAKAKKTAGGVTVKIPQLTTVDSSISLDTGTSQEVRPQSEVTDGPKLYES